MNKIKINKGKGSYDYRAQVKFETVPVITSEVKDEQGVTTHYMCEGNRMFTKDGYERAFGLNHGIKMKPRGYKGKSLDSRVIE